MINAALPELRPLRMGELLDQAIRLYRKNFFNFIGIISLVYVPITLLPVFSSLLMYGSLQSAQTSPTFSLGSNYWAGIGLSLLSLVLQLILVQGLGTAVLTRAIADNYLGRPTGILEAYKRVGSKWLRLLAAYLLGLLIILAVCLWTIIPCVGWLTGGGLAFFLSLVVLPFVASAIVIEKVGASAGLRRAWDLARRRFWWLLGYMLLLTLFSQLIVTGPSYLVSYLVRVLIGNNGSYLTTTVAGTIAQTLTAIISGVLYLPLQLTAITLAYFDLRVRTEGFDMAMLATEASSETGVEAASQAPVTKGSDPLLTWGQVGYFVAMTVGVVAIYFLIVAVVVGIAMATTSMLY